MHITVLRSTGYLLRAPRDIGVKKFSSTSNFTTGIALSGIQHGGAWRAPLETSALQNSAVFLPGFNMVTWIVVMVSYTRDGPKLRLSSTASRPFRVTWIVDT